MAQREYNNIMSLAPPISRTSVGSALLCLSPARYASSSRALLFLPALQPIGCSTRWHEMRAAARRSSTVHARRLLREPRRPTRATPPGAGRRRVTPSDAGPSDPLPQRVT